MSKKLGECLATNASHLPRSDSRPPLGGSYRLSHQKADLAKKERKQLDSFYRDCQFDQIGTPAALEEFALGCLQKSRREILVTVPKRKHREALGLRHRART